jgi:thioredoxin reductase (NADPH)
MLNPMEARHRYDVIVVGGGPAGLTAGIYLSRARLNTLILNEGTAGGQMILTHEIANYPGVEKTTGYQLANIMKRQATDFGCDIRSNVRIADIELEGIEKRIMLSDGTSFSSDALILTPGGRSRTLGIPGEDEFKGKGISYCATCDGDFFSGKEIIVVGGGNSALEEAVSLTRYASKVTIVHQFDHFQAFSHAIEEAEQNPKIDFIMQSVLVEYNGNEQLESVDIKDLKTGNISRFTTDGVFVFIGYTPNTAFLRDRLHLNTRDEIVVTKDMETNIKGVYAAGDSIEKRYRQISTAVGDATIAALAASEYIYALKEEIKHALINA